MDLLEVPLPELRLVLDQDTSTFFDRCEEIARDQGWNIDRRPAYAGPGYDQLNLHIGRGREGRPILRMVSTPDDKGRLSLDVVAEWTTSLIDYDEYVDVSKASYDRLLTEYKKRWDKRYRLGVPRKPKTVDFDRLDCSKISYAAEKFMGLTRSLAIGTGDARDRLVNAFTGLHVIRPEDLPEPLDSHLRWVYTEITKRPARHRFEGSVEATVRTMKNRSAARVLERLVDLAEAIDRLYEYCQSAQRRRG